MMTITPVSSKPRTLPLSLRVVIIALLTAIVVGHGCHGDDVDHEPVFFPPVVNLTKVKDRD